LKKKKKIELRQNSLFLKETKRKRKRKSKTFFEQQSYSHVICFDGLISARTDALIVSEDQKAKAKL